MQERSLLIASLQRCRAMQPLAATSVLRRECW